jgi:hypothetical protein
VRGEERRSTDETVRHRPWKGLHCKESNFVRGRMDVRAHTKRFAICQISSRIGAIEFGARRTGPFVHCIEQVFYRWTIASEPGVRLLYSAI